jgi:hypothetical protein
MDAVTATAIKIVNTDLQDTIEEALATRLILLEFIQQLLHNSTLTAGEVAVVVENAKRSASSSYCTTKEEQMLVDRMHNRIASIGEALGVPDGFAGRQQ